MFHDLHVLLALPCWILFAVGAWVATFRSPAVIHLLDRYTADDLHTPKDVEVWLLERQHWFLHTLWTCRVCQAVWTAALAALGFLIGYPQGWWSVLYFPFFLLISLPPVLWIQKQL